MAQVSVRLIEKDLEVLRRDSPGAWKKALEQLKKLEQDPDSFEDFEDETGLLLGRDDLRFKKVKVTYKRHDYRILGVQRKYEEGEDQIDMVQLFPRKRGYDIDWAKIADIIQ
jgi:hypothetical protein